MAFERNHGTCCMVLPLKLGVGLTSALILLHSLICILALLTGDIRFQGNGYSPGFYRVPAVVGAFGLLFGFVGMLGTYDDKGHYLWWLNRYFWLKLALTLATMIADYSTLYQCEGWKHRADHLENSQLDALSKSGVCPWARWSYLIGCVVDFSFWAYLATRSYKFEQDVYMNPPHAIDFGMERYDSESRWHFFQVKDPRKKPSFEGTPVIQEEDPYLYGAMLQEADEAPAFGPDGMRIRRPVEADRPQPYGVDGMPQDPGRPPVVTL